MYAHRTLSVTLRILHRLLHVVLPYPCLACDEPVELGTQGLGLCRSCEARLETWPDSSCVICQNPLPGAAPGDEPRCGPCRLRPAPFDRSLALWRYQAPIDAVLLALKFRRLRYLGKALGHQLATRLAPQLRDVEVVVPVPLHWRRRLARGYDQAELLAGSIAKSLRLACRQALRRKRHTPPQSLLQRTERQRNLTTAFTVRRPAWCRHRHVLLVDDVATTGSTLHAAAAAVRRAQPASITVVSVARTPFEDKV